MADEGWLGQPRRGSDRPQIVVSAVRGHALGGVASVDIPVHPHRRYAGLHQLLAQLRLRHFAGSDPWLVDHGLSLPDGRHRRRLVLGRERCAHRQRRLCGGLLRHDRHAPRGSDSEHPPEELPRHVVRHDHCHGRCRCARGQGVLGSRLPNLVPANRRCLHWCGGGRRGRVEQAQAEGACSRVDGERRYSPEHVSGKQAMVAKGRAGPLCAHRAGVHRILQLLHSRRPGRWPDQFG
mmetsp:Transcript_66481/g.191920  ORF Transcript_66481/g.191920 Transcript_66481/m.191920 type:complete len:236 (+) Transcript_66481:640-1347(+)